jgi:undecaprenyl-phosphate 4-deoxy-4-formamido-L-arabinose transferase
MITGFTVLPLQIASLLGFGFMLFGAVLLVWIFGMWLFVGKAPAGFAFLGSSIAIFSGVQLFCLGIIGEYLARIHFRIMERPTYTVGEIAERPQEPPANQV